MKKVFLMFFALLCICNEASYAQKCQWSRNIGGNFKPEKGVSNLSAAVCTDKNGNVYVTGYFMADTLTFTNDIYLTNSGSDNHSDAYLAKYNSNGECQWAKSMAGLNTDNGVALVADASGSIIVSGNFKSPTINFSNGISLTNNTKNGTFLSQDGFLAKYNTNGECQWAKSISGDGIDGVSDINIDYSGNILVSGFYWSTTLNFNNGITLNQSEYIDGFLAKYNTNGECQWAKKIAGSGGDGVVRISGDNVGNIFIIGTSTGTNVKFSDAISLNKAVPDTTNDGFLAKYNTNGECQWAKKIASQGEDYLRDITIDQTGNIFIAGIYNGTSIDFNNGNKLTNSGTAGSFDGYLAKYDLSGDCKWVKSIAGDKDDNILKIATDAMGNIIIAGWYTSSLTTFSSQINIKNTSIINDATDGFLAKYSTAGECNWAFNISGSAATEVHGLALDALGFAYITGAYSFEINFDNGSKLTTRSLFDGYIAKIAMDVNAVDNNETIKPAISIKPNPATNSIIISGVSLLNADAKISIYNNLGALVIPVTLNSQTGESTEQSIDVSGLQAGTYRVVITTLGKSVSQGFSVVR